MLRQIDTSDVALEISRILNPEVCDEELPGLVMVGVYIDESETDETGVFTLAGWLASEPTGWKDIIPAWKEMVATAPHPITEFHMTDIAQRQAEFADGKGWTKDERTALVTRATDILTDKSLSGGLTAFGCSVHRDEMTMAAATSYDLYKLCYEVLMMQICLTFRAFRAFNFVFDNKEKVRGHVFEHFFGVQEDLNKIPTYHAC